MSTTVLEPETITKVKLLPPYHVIIHNDDFHTFPFVVNVIRKVFGFSMERCVELTKSVHYEGRAIVWTGSKEVAELRVEQVSSYREGDLGPVDVSIEPAE